MSSPRGLARFRWPIALYFGIAFAGYGLAWRDFSSRVVQVSGLTQNKIEGTLRNVNSSGFGETKTYKFHLEDPGIEYTFYAAIAERSDIDALLVNGKAVKITFVGNPPAVIELALDSGMTIVPWSTGTQNLQKIAESGKTRGLLFLVLGILMGLAPIWVARLMPKRPR